MSSALVAAPGLYPMAEPLWPERSIYHAGSTPETVRILEHWVMGDRVHPYGFTAWERYGRDAAFSIPPHLHIQGSSDGDGMRWSVSGWRRGDDGTGRFFCSGQSHPADACYAALTLIEEEEREEWEAQLVLGIA